MLYELHWIETVLKALWVMLPQDLHPYMHYKKQCWTNSRATWNWMERDNGKGTALPPRTLQVWKKGHFVSTSLASLSQEAGKHSMVYAGWLQLGPCKTAPSSLPAYAYHCRVQTRVRWGRREKSLTASHRGNGRDTEAERSSWQSFLMWITQELFFLLLKQKLWALNTKNWRRVWHGNITDCTAEQVLTPLAHYVKGEKHSSSKKKKKQTQQ